MAADDNVNFTKKLNYIVTVGPNCTKFGSEIQLATAQTTGCSKYVIFEIQDAAEENVTIT